MQVSIYLWVEIDGRNAVWVLEDVQAVLTRNVPQSNSLSSKVRTHL